MSPPRSAPAAPAADPGAGAAAAARLVDRADEAADTTGWPRRWIWPVIVGVAVVVGTMAAGVDWWRCVVLAAAITVALWSLIAATAAPVPAWHEDVPGRAYRLPSTWEVPGLAAARESDTAFEEYLRPRLWALTCDLLAARGIDPESDAARDLVGTNHYRLLNGQDTDPKRRTASVSALCHIVAWLAVDPGADGPVPVAEPNLQGLAGGPPAGPARRLAARGKGNHA